MSRQEQDDFAVSSQKLACQRIEEGFWAREITPVTLPDGAVVSADEGPRPGTTLAGGMFGSGVVLWLAPSSLAKSSSPNEVCR